MFRMNFKKLIVINQKNLFVIGGPLEMSSLVGLSPHVWRASCNKLILRACICVLALELSSYLSLTSDACVEIGFSGEFVNGSGTGEHYVFCEYDKIADYRDFLFLLMILT
jgi:hypothetical protein